MRDRVEVEVGERGAEVLALAEDRQPAQASLKPSETDLLEQASIVSDRLAPLFVVITDVERVGAAPPTALHRKIPRISSPIVPSKPRSARSARCFMLPECSSHSCEGTSSPGLKYST